MTDRTPAALVSSLALHALVVGILLLFSYSLSFPSKTPPKIFELVAGEGTNYMATEAPALGTPGGVKVNVPVVPVPKPETPAKVEPPPAKPESAPITPAPPAKIPATKTVPSPAKRILTQIANGKLRAEREIAKQREEEQKRAATAAKIQHIDAAGIAKGVVGGSTANTDSGAGGRALSAAEGSRMERYQSALIAALRRALEQEKPPGLSESLVATVEFHWGADGTLSGVHITKPSGSREFDDAVRAAFRRVSGSLGPRPDGKSEVVELDFKAREQDGD
jgi:colicin import membrane protein